MLEWDEIIEISNGMMLLIRMTSSERMYGRKPVLTACLTLFLALCFFSPSLIFGKQPESSNLSETSVVLSETEKAWLAEHKLIRLGIDPAWPPFEFLDPTKVYYGIASDYVRLLNKRLEINMEPVQGLSWPQVMGKVRTGQIDILPCIVKTRQRSKLLSFTKPYLNFPMVILTREGAPFVNGVQDFADQRVGVVKGYVTQELLERDFPRRFFYLASSVDEALKAVSKGRIDAFVGNMASITYASRKLGLTNLKIAATTPYKYELAFGVRKDWPEMVTILEKSLAAIPDPEKTEIHNRWINVRFERLMDWKLILPIAGGIIIVSACILFFILKWNRALSREVAERKRAEEAIKDSEQSMAQIINFLPDPTWVVDKDGIVVAWNRALEKITGVKAEDMLGRGNYEYALPFYRERRPVLIDLVRVWDTEYEKEYVSVKKEGETLISESLHPNLGENGLYLSGTARLLHAPSGEVMGAIESLRDITEHKQVEKAIQKSEKEYRTLFENANDAILVAQNQMLCLANPQLEKLLGFSQEELTSRPVTDFFHPEERHVILERHERRLKGESIPDTYVSRVVDKLGATKWVELKVVLIEWDDRPAVLGFMADITERKQAEEELRQNFQELETFSKMAVGREEQMIELKKEINELLREAGKSEKYKIVT